MTTKQQNSFPLRMPDDLRARLEERAESTGRSVNSEIVSMLTAMLDRESDLANAPIEALLNEVTGRLDARVQIVVSEDIAHQTGLAAAPKSKTKRRG